ncbi:hypothetical protein [Acetobacter persici]|uniref:Uncharacterized protein n=1 Tax=Acetobacter persici TaxID=1076596 RepID=A0A1U9LJR2_9PROT|nr:hypothetical protein [Acetobacter persici]AQT06662.1 hypothetical protein A0U91_16795 [Acetobacter persici]
MSNIDAKQTPTTEGEKKKRGVFGWDPVKLYQNYSTSELVKMKQEIEAKPENLNPQHLEGTSIYIYTKSARKKLDALSWAISYHLADKKAETRT